MMNGFSYYDKIKDLFLYMHILIKNGFIFYIHQINLIFGAKMKIYVIFNYNKLYFVENTMNLINFFDKIF